MKQRICSLLLVVVLLAGQALAMGNTPYKDMHYTRPTDTVITQNLAQIQTLTKDVANAARVLALYDEMQKSYVSVTTMWVLVENYAFADTTNKYYMDEDTYCNQLMKKLEEKMRLAACAILDSPCGEAFTAQWGEETAAYIRSMSEKTPAYQALEEKETNLVTRFNELSTKQYQDEEESARTLGEIYVELLGVRSQMAKLAGVSSYLELVYPGYKRTYTPAEAQKLHTEVAKVWEPVATKFERSANFSRIGEIDALDWDVEEIMDRTRPLLEKLSPKLLGPYDAMRKLGLYDVETRENKMAMGYTAPLPDYDTAFFFLLPQYKPWDITGFFHEFGHYNQMVATPDNYSFPYRMDLDLLEVHSQGMELLLSDSLPDLLGDLAETERNYITTRVASIVMQGCLIDAFEQYAYAHPASTYEELCAKFHELKAEYGMSASFEDSTWANISHIYQTPGYYLSYAVSAISALEIWSDAQTDRDAGVAKYFKIVDYAQSPYLEALSASGLKNPFAGGLLPELRGTLEKKFGLITDTYGHWAEEASDVLCAYGYLSGYLQADGTRRFFPDQTMTRAQFARMLCGDKIEKDAPAPFTDVALDAWYAPYVNTLAAQGILTGTSATCFAPDAPITRQDMAVVFERYLAQNKQVLPAHEEAKPFTDAASIAGYAQGAVTLLQAGGILTGLPDGSFAPNATVTRAAAAAALYRMFGTAKPTEGSSTTAQTDLLRPTPSRVWVPAA